MLECNMEPRLQNIEACYTSTYKRYKDNVDSFDSMREELGIVKAVVIEHSAKLQKLA